MSNQPSGGFHHVAIRVSDFDASVRFYTEGLGFRETMRWGEGDGRAIMLDTGNGNFLELFAGGTPGEKPEGAWLHLALNAADCDAALARAVAAGARVTKAPASFTIPSTPQEKPIRYAFCAGPDGESIEFFQEL